MDTVKQPIKAKGSAGTRKYTAEEIRRRVEELGLWFHNMNLGGVWTAPDHFLGDYPTIKWRRFAHLIPEDLSGKTVLDIGSNGGFYSIEMKRRGAKRVVAIDSDDDYLAQARFAAEVTDAEIEFHRLSVYDVEKLGERFDYTFFMGVFYHLRYPLYALDKVVRVVRERLIFQTMIRGSHESKVWPDDLSFWDYESFKDPSFPCMYFVEEQLAHDPTVWWIPNGAAAEAMLRSAGLELLEHPEPEIWICRPSEDEPKKREAIGL